MSRRFPRPPFSSAAAHLVDELAQLVQPPVLVHVTACQSVPFSLGDDNCTNHPPLLSDETLSHPRAFARDSNGQNQPRAYTLCYREDEVRVFWRMDDRPILLHENGLQWSAPNSPMQRATFEDIVRIRLVVVSGGEDGSIGSCILHFKQGRILTVMGGNNWGVCEPQKAELYRRFVHDLHRRLGADDCSRIKFLAGHTEGSRGLSRAALILAALFFILLPLGLFVATGEPECLFLMLGGFAFASPFFRLFKANTPRNYSPRNIPAELLP